MKNKYFEEFYELAINEDIGNGDHTSLSCIQKGQKGKARLLIKENGIIAGVEAAKHIFLNFDPLLNLNIFFLDGDEVKPGDIVFTINGNVHSILQTERLILNIMQRMSGIATLTNKFVNKLNGLHTKVLDTRKTTPCFRYYEKEAVKIGGGVNHRFGLYDMILIKDNHIDFAGGIENAIKRTKQYIHDNNLDLRVEIEARNIDDINKIISIGGIDRIMLDNFSVENTKKAVELIKSRFETESSGGITLDTIRSYAECGVDFISIGAITHQFKSMDMSLKAMKIEHNN
jgi:nicotinate-nucleotide pyrophosphorylase (carboxylating)